MSIVLEKPQERDYQTRVIEKTLAFFEAGDTSVLIESPTGSGKTIMALSICKQLEEKYGFRTNWVAMRRNLLRQVVESNDRFFGMKKLTPVSMFDKNPPKAEITVVDEAQHDATASASNIHEQSESVSQFILGLSATPQRTDNLKLAFRRTVKDAGIHRLIRDGWLAPYDHWCIDAWNPTRVAEAYLRDVATWGKSAVFFHRIDQCEEFASILADHGHHAEVITAASDRDGQLDAFDAGKFKVVVNVAILNEGFDCPNLQTVFVRDSARLPTVQMAGRGFRLSLETGKTHCNIVQSGNAHWQFTRTARPRQAYARRGNRWLALGNSMVLDTIAQQTIQDIAAVEVNLPKYLSSAAQKKRKSADRRRIKRNDRNQ